MVAKMDREEILSALGYQMRMIVIILVLIIVTAGSLLGFMYQESAGYFLSGKI